MTWSAEGWLGDAAVDSAVGLLRPDYRALLVLAEGVMSGPSDTVSERILLAAEREARLVLGGEAPETHPHVAAWRDAFRAFGAKPQRTRPSVEALLRRLVDRLPRVDRLTDAYNAVSIAHAVPIGGEDADRYGGPPRLVRASGDEQFDTTSGGGPAVEHPLPGEVVWRDDLGVTCRRWNWRQCMRTRLTPATSRAVFVLDALAPMSDQALWAAGQALLDAVQTLSPGAQVATRIVHPDHAAPEAAPGSG